MKSILVLLWLIYSAKAFSAAFIGPQTIRIATRNPDPVRPFQRQNIALFSSLLNETLLENPSREVSDDPRKQEEKSPTSRSRGIKTAIVLNVNARSVTEALVKIAQDVLGEEGVFLSHAMKRRHRKQPGM